MSACEYGVADFQFIAAGAAILASGGGGSYCDAIALLEELSLSGWSGVVQVQGYDGATNCCVLAMMGSPDAAVNLKLENIKFSIANTLSAYSIATGTEAGCLIPVEIGSINSIVPLIAAAILGLWVVDGDGAGRAVPELPQTTYAGSANLPASPCALSNDAVETTGIQSAILNASSAATLETLAGGIVSAFGSFSGIALWSSNAGNGYALTNNYIAGTLTQARALGKYLMTSASVPTTAMVAAEISRFTNRKATAIISNFYITAITESTTSTSLDAGIIRLDNTPDQAGSTETHYIYNLNENLIMYSNLSAVPDIIAPDSICYYSESTGRGFSNASNDLALYFDTVTGKSTEMTVSIIQVETASQLYQSPGVLASFAGLLRKIGYAGAISSK